MSWSGMVAVGAALAVCGAALGAGPAGADMSRNGTDPVASGCAAKTSVTANLPLPDERGETTALTLRVLRSPACDTTWVEIDNPYPDGTAEVHTSIAVAATDILYQRTAARTGRQISPQVFAPGRTCIKVSATVTSAGRVLAGGGPATKIC
ncbi:hypothetical protein [Nocardia asteroides]|uniref:hypothetical protein n=1 Tax=Nocardia asteroides TaxID=1824 RepID=UPI001E3EB01F|nr:hypothetical protein [Nocardia asteroides]UGT61770.1 hypothetical protein LTT61_32490 [Nocardia asteroides]